MQAGGELVGAIRPNASAVTRQLRRTINSGMRGNPLPTKSGLCESGETSSRPRFGLEGERDEGHLALLLMLGTVAPLLAEEVRVRGHYRSDGTYVQPHMRSTPDY
jgi:hypothetical protein